MVTAVEIANAKTALLHSQNQIIEELNEKARSRGATRIRREAVGRPSRGEAEDLDIVREFFKSLDHGESEKQQPVPCFAYGAGQFKHSRLGLVLGRPALVKSRKDWESKFRQPIEQHVVRVVEWFDNLSPRKTGLPNGPAEHGLFVWGGKVYQTEAQWDLLAYL